jgi:hypothetical protein
VGLLGHGLALPRLLLGRLQASAGALPAQVRGDRASIGGLRCVSHCRCHTSCVAIGSEFDAFGRRSSAAFAKHGSSRRTAVQSAHRTFCEAGHSLESMARSARPRTGRKCRHRYLLRRFGNKRLLLQHTILLRVDADHPLSVEFSRLMIPYAQAARRHVRQAAAGTIDQTPDRPDASEQRSGNKPLEPSAQRRKGKAVARRAK